MKKQVLLVVVSVTGLIGTLMYAGDDVKSVPLAVTNAVIKMFPGVTIEEVAVETEGVQVYEADLEGDGIDGEVTVAADGTVLEKEMEVVFDALPREIKAALLKLANTDQIKEVSEETVYYEVVLKQLKTPRIGYEAEIERDGQEIIVELDATGKIVKQEVEQSNDEQDVDHSVQDDLDND